MVSRVGTCPASKVENDHGNRPTTARSIGQTAAQGALYSALFNIASGIGRIAFGVVADFMTGVSRSHPVYRRRPWQIWNPRFV
jgi:hypothetical protein